MVSMRSPKAVITLGNGVSVRKLPCCIYITRTHGSCGNFNFYLGICQSVKNILLSLIDTNKTIDEMQILQNELTVKITLEGINYKYPPPQKKKKTKKNKKKTKKKRKTDKKENKNIIK